MNLTERERLLAFEAFSTGMAMILVQTLGMDPMEASYVGTRILTRTWPNVLMALGESFDNPTAFESLKQAEEAARNE